MAFHAVDGWYFERLENGHVKIKVKCTQADAIEHFVILPPAIWASVISSVSYSDESSDRWVAAVKFHNGDKPFG